MDGNLFNPLTATTVRDNNTPLPTGNDKILPVVNQTQYDTGTQPVDNDSDSEDSHIASNSKGLEHDNIAKQSNVAIIRTDDYLATEIKVITGHRYLKDILELKVEYTHGEQSCRPIGLINDEDPHTVANYVLSNDLGPVSNGIHRRWAHLLIRSLKLTLRRLRCTIFE